MNLITKAISWVSPGWAARRLRSQIQFSAYEAAIPSRTRKLKKESRGANTAVFAAGASLREQARWLDENHDLAIGILDKLEERVVGARGIQVEPQPLTYEGKVHEEFAATLSALWDRWAEAPDVTGMYTLAEAERPTGSLNRALEGIGTETARNTVLQTAWGWQLGRSLGVAAGETEKLTRAQELLKKSIQEAVLAGKDTARLKKRYAEISQELEKATRRQNRLTEAMRREVQMGDRRSCRRCHRRDRHAADAQCQNRGRAWPGARLRYEHSEIQSRRRPGGAVRT